MNRDAAVRGRAPVDLRVGLLADGRDHDSQPLRPRRIQQQKRKPPVAGNEAEFHGYLITPRSLRSMKCRQQRRVLALQLLDLLQSLRGVQLGRQQQPESLLQHLQPLRRKSPPRQSNLINPEGLVLPLGRGQRKRQHVLSHNRPAADKCVRADDAMLMHRAEGPHGGVVLDDHVAGQRGAVGQDAVAAHLAVVADMHPGHQ